MPMTFDDNVLRDYAEMAGVPLEPQNTLRERAATHSENIDPPDYVQAWEIRTGRPWTDMTPDEAFELLGKHPSLRGNHGVLSRLGAKK
jgi:hypothetical protein